MNEDIALLLFFFEFATILANANVLLLPIFGANRVAPRLNNDAFECFDSLAHLFVQLLLH